MNVNSGNVSKTKKLRTGEGKQSKANRKSFQKLSESSSLSSNRNSSAQSEDDVRVGGVYIRPLTGNNNVSFEEQEIVMKKLQGQVKELRHKLRILEESVESKDYSLGTIAREKDRAVGEIRRLERSNKQLRQQLSDERTHYLEEKEKFCEEMTRYKKRIQDLKTMTEGKKPSTKWSPILPISKQSLITQQLRWQLSNEKGDGSDSKAERGDSKMMKSQKSSSGVKENKSCPLSSIKCTESHFRKAGSLESLHLYEGNDISLQMAALRTENAKLRSIICERDERNYELCLRFLRMKHYKNDIRSRFQDLENEYLQVISNLMEKIDEARQEFNFIIDQKFKRPLHSTNAMYLQLVQRNSRMTFENASLRLENQFLKKELNKYMNGVPDLERKVDQISAGEDQTSRLNLDSANSNTKLKRIKKNVNFKEIRTIYERELALKNSDTDSNYMSKTSTTVPSNGSLVDPKSNESIIESKDNKIVENQNQAQPAFQAKTIPSEILNQIFKRIDTASSCQSLESSRQKDVIIVGDKPPDERCQVNGNVSQSVEKKSEEEVRHLQNVSEVVFIEHKTPAKVLESSSDSKESIKRLGCLRGGVKISEEDKTKYPGIPRRTRQGPKTLRFDTSRLKGPKYLDKDSGDGSSSLDFPTRKIPPIGRHRTGKGDRSNQEQLEVRTRFKMREIRDSCGLQEKLEISDFEAAQQHESVDNRIQNPVKSERFMENHPTEVDLKKDIQKYEERERTSVTRRRQNTRQQIPLSRTISKCNNSVNLRDEIMEATRSHLNDGEAFTKDELRKRETKIQTIFTKTQAKTYRIDEDSSSLLEDVQMTNRNNSCSTAAVDTFLTQSQEQSTYSGRCDDIHTQSYRPGEFSGPEVMSNRRPEGSKRFSHRLISTTPEQLRSLLKESQMGACYRMAPILVNHATTDVSSAFQYNESNTGIVLQLVIPPGNVGQTSQLLSNLAEIPEKPTVEKETSMSGLSPLCTKKSSVFLREATTSDIFIPISNLPTSSSTVDMVDSTPLHDRTNIMLRTLSAPGLLESNWLDPQTLCEMRDCKFQSSSSACLHTVETEPCCRSGNLSHLRVSSKTLLELLESRVISDFKCQ